MKMFPSYRSSVSPRLSVPRLVGALGLGVLAIGSQSSQAQTVVWGGGDGQYLEGANWIDGELPNTAGGGTAQIDSGNVIYTPGGDLFITNGGTLQLNGGSWTQVDGIAWIQMSGGNLNIAGGTFNQGTAGNIVKTAATTINVSAGVANFNGNLLYQPVAEGAFNLTGGTVNIQAEFKPIATFNMTAGSLNANLISFADGPGNINFSGGSISVNGAAAFNGLYGGGAQFIDFTLGSTGSLFFSNLTLAGFNATSFLTNGTLRYDGAISSEAFTVFEQGGGVMVTAIPEPATVGMLALGVGAVILFRRRKTAK